MPRKSRTDRELGWLSSIWEEMALVETRHGAFSVVELRPTVIRSIFTVRLSAARAAVDEERPGWSYSSLVRYPTGDNTEFLAWLWGRASRFADEAALSDTSATHGEF